MSSGSIVFRNNEMRRHTNRVFLLSIVSILIVSPIFGGYFASAAVVENAETDVFTFVRLKYRGSWGHRGKWDTDWPASDRNFIRQLREQTNVRVSSKEKIIDIGSKELFHYPFGYMVDVKRLKFTDAEASNLREYLLRGGFILVDDFHGRQAWKGFNKQLQKIFPDREPEDIPISHPIFHCFYNINELMQIPGAGAARRGRTYERGSTGGRHVRCLGIYDDKGRLMMMINFNTDWGDAWEHAADSFYPREYSDMAFKMGINAVIYSLTH